MSTPLHQRLTNELREAIRSGGYPPGSRLPSEHELARSHRVARSTVRRALAALDAEGAIASRRGTRRVVLGEPLMQPFAELHSFSAWARSLGARPAGRVVRLARRRPDPAEAEVLGLAADELVHELVRVRLLDEQPVMIERSVFVESVGTLLGSVQLERESIYERLAGHGVLFARARHTIDAVPASAEDAELLDVAPGAPLLRDRRRTTAADGRPLEWSDDRYRGDAVAFVVENSAASSSLGRVLTEEDDGPR